LGNIEKRPSPRSQSSRNGPYSAPIGDGEELKEILYYTFPRRIKYTNRQQEHETELN
jgi:hypothetical protein